MKNREIDPAYKIYSKLATPMQQAGCMHHHMQITVIIISYIATGTLLHNLSWVEKMPYGRFWMGKWLSGGTEMNDIVL